MNRFEIKLELNTSKTLLKTEVNIVDKLRLVNHHLHTLWDNNECYYFVFGLERSLYAAAMILLQLEMLHEGYTEKKIRYYKLLNWWKNDVRCECVILLQL